MGYDKRMALHNRRRISESMLLSLAILGGSFGGLAAMPIFHHKTKKSYFWLIFLIASFVHIFVLWRFL